MAQSQLLGGAVRPVFFDKLEELRRWHTQSANLSRESELDSLNVATEPFSSYERAQTGSGSRSSEPVPGDKEDPPIKLMVCHDFKGGYQDYEDAQPLGYFPHPTGSRYFLQYPQLIDQFVYFSHHRVTVPPVNWINFCHRNGIKCFGTVIFEGNASKDFEELDRLVSRDEKGDFVFVDALIKLAAHYGFDGYLLNIETTFSNTKIAADLEPFAEQLKSGLHCLDSKNELIWYDSYVFPANKVSYTNGVTESNYNFFSLSDAFFSNYWWNIKNLQENIKNVGVLGVQKKIYVGYDVWGRGTLVGKGGFDSSLACKMIAKFKSNVALFAPAWTYESLGPKDFNQNDARFWIGLFENESSISSTVPPHSSAVYKINESSFIFYTNFSSGEGNRFFSKGSEVYRKNWVNGSLQFDLPIDLHRKDKNGLQWALDKSDAFHGGACLEIKYSEIKDENGYQIFNNQMVSDFTLFNFTKECHFPTVNVKVTYKLNHKTKSTFKIKIKYIIERRFRSVQTVRTGYLTIPLLSTSGKWFTVEESFQINLQTSHEYIVLESAHVTYDEDRSADSFFRSYIVEDSAITSVIDNEEYEKLINSEIYNDDEDEDWILVPSDVSISSSESQSNDSKTQYLGRKLFGNKSTPKTRTLEGTAPLLRIGEFAIISANNYPSSNFLAVTSVKSIESSRLEGDSLVLLNWQVGEGHQKGVCYYIIYVNGAVVGLSVAPKFIYQDTELASENSASARSNYKKSGLGSSSDRKSKVRVDSVDKLGNVFTGSEVWV
uniref:Endo-beta-N-acetylglucosaminidase n=1 Tax=Ogataea minuta TaxID=36026 RepID=R4WHQ8_9ASCO|nr:endo-beta-N-acetylglucosaminidase [Ogataea minuta]